MNQYTIQVSTLADVRAAISAQSDLNRKKREQMISALASLAAWRCCNLEDIRANVPELAALFEKVQPAALGIAPKTLANVKSLCLKALSISELAPGILNDIARNRPKNPVWANIYANMTTPAQRNSVSRLINFCNRNDIGPQVVDDVVIDRVMTETSNVSLRPNQYRIRRAMTKVWNEVVDIFPEQRLQKVTVPLSRRRHTRIPLEEFQQSFLDDWDDFARWAHGEDIFADDARPVRLKQSTIDMMKQRIHLAATALVESGVPISEICTLADLTQPEAFRRIFGRRNVISEGRANYYDFYTARQIVQLAKEWVKVDVETLAELKRLVRKIPQPTFGMTRKNKLLVTQFDDSVLKERLLTAPDRIWADAQSDSRRGRLRLAQAQAALAISILTYHPVRLGNLAGLRFDEHLHLNAQGVSTLSLSSEETKTGAAVDYEIPPVLADRLIQYREVIAPAILGFRPQHLFSNAEDKVKDKASTRYLVMRYVKLYVGVHLNPHAFRHLAAKFILDNNPGAHVVVQHLLGHKKLATTASFYAGVDTVRAGRHHQTLLDGAMAKRTIMRPARRTTCI